MQRSRRLPRGKNPMVALLFRAPRRAPPKELPLQLHLILRQPHPLHNSPMRRPGDLVRLPDKRDLVIILDDPALVDRLLQDLQVLLAELEEGDVLGDLPRDGEDGPRAVRAEVGEHGVHIRGELDLVDVVLLEGLLRAEGQAGPDNVVRVDGRDEQRGAVGGDVVREVAVSEAVCPCQVVEVSALSAPPLETTSNGPDSQKQCGRETYRKCSGESLSSCNFVIRPSR